MSWAAVISPYLMAGRALALAAVLLCGSWGCAGHRVRQPDPASAPAVAQWEEFDPGSLDEELLLIQPAFSPPEISPADTAQGTALAPALSPVGLAPPVYRLQIIAFRTEELARQRAAELGALLGAPVRVVAERGLFMVQAGQFDSPAGAEALRERLIELRPEYAEAYVIPRPVRAPGAAWPQAGSPAPLSGWRVLIDQFLNYEEAEQLRQEAAERLQRTDIEVNFRAPWFKVEVGHFRSEAQAQELVGLIQSHGYRNVLKVREKIEASGEGRP